MPIGGQTAGAAEYLRCGRNAALQIGPNKERPRARAKLAELEQRGRTDPEAYPDKDKEVYICDWLRARVVFANPTALAVFFWYLMAKGEENFSLKVLSVKNKLRFRPGDGPEGDTSASIQINVSLNSQGEPHVAEIQLVLENMILAKDLEHKYYEFKRAARLTDILKPVFPV